jgi:hypothetical protein
MSTLTFQKALDALGSQPGQYNSVQALYDLANRSTSMPLAASPFSTVVNPPLMAPMENPSSARRQFLRR